MKASRAGEFAARRAVVRWSLRLVRREWRQQVLVIALLTAAVGAAAFAASAAYNITPSRDGEFGGADHRLRLNISDPAALAPYLAAAQEWFGVIDVIGHRHVPVPGSVEAVEFRSQDPDGVYGAPTVRLLDGRYPRGSDEVALTDLVAGLLDATIGEEVALGGGSWTVVGLIENPGDLDDDFALITPGRDVSADAVTILLRASDQQVRSFTVADEPGTGFVDPRGITEKTAAALVVLVISTVALLLVSLVAATGFVVVAQRRLRQLGMLAAMGATERHLRLVMVANGAAVGVVAASAGTAFGLASWLTIAERFEVAAGHRIARFDLPWEVIAAGLLLAVGTATAAAWWPARAVARVPVTLALSARPPRPRPAHRSALVAALLLPAGVACLAVGINPAEDQGNPLLVIPGIVAVAAAVLLLAPPALGALAFLAARSPLAVRLALRDLARYQARSGGALAAISVALAIAVSTVLIAAASTHDADEGNLSDRQLLVRFRASDADGSVLVPDPEPAEVNGLQPVVDGLARTLGGAAVTPLAVAVDPAITEVHEARVLRPPVVLGRPVGEGSLRGSGLVYVATAELLGHLGLDGGLVDADALLVTAQPGDVYLTGELSNTTYRRDPVPAAEVERVGLPAYTSAPRSFITDRGLDVGGWRPAAYGWLVETPEPLTEAQLADARDLAADAGLTIEARRTQQGLSTIRSIASAAGLLLALGILAMTVGLIRGESAGDLRALTAIGATNGTRRMVTAATAGALALLGVVLATTIAYLAVAAGFWPDTGRLEPVPVGHLITIAVGLPVAATAAGWVLAGRELSGLARAAIE